MIGALATLLLGAGCALADDGATGVLPLLKSWWHYDPGACANACNAPVQKIPGVQLFRGEIGQPKYVEGKKLPPIELVRAVPPPVELVRGASPPVELVRGMPPPVELVRGMPPPVEFFRRQPELPTEAPPICKPSVTIFRLEQPPCPALPPPVCTCAH
jgi:hypothetical protein